MVKGGKSRTERVKAPRPLVAASAHLTAAAPAARKRSETKAAKKKTALLERLREGLRRPVVPAAAKKRRNRGVGAALASYEGLGEALAEVEAKRRGGAGGAERGGAAGGRAFGEAVATNRVRETVRNVEERRLDAVLRHPEFLADPLAALTSHIAAHAPEAPTPTSQRPQKRRNGNSKEKRRERAASKAGRRAPVGDLAGMQL